MEGGHCGPLLEGVLLLHTGIGDFSLVIVTF